MIDQIGVGVQELGQLARGLNEELQQQSIMIDGLEERIDTTQAHGVQLYVIAGALKSVANCAL